MRPFRCLSGPLCGLCAARRRDRAEALAHDHAAWMRAQRMLAAIAASR